MNRLLDATWKIRFCNITLINYYTSEKIRFCNITLINYYTSEVCYFLVQIELKDVCIFNLLNSNILCEVTSSVYIHYHPHYYLASLIMSRIVFNFHCHHHHCHHNHNHHHHHYHQINSHLSYQSLKITFSICQITLAQNWGYGSI